MHCVEQSAVICFNVSVLTITFSGEGPGSNIFSYFKKGNSFPGEGETQRGTKTAAGGESL